MAELHKRALSRRAFLSAGAAAALGGGTALVLGCGGGGHPSQTPAAGGVSGSRQGGEIVIGHPISVLGIDPHIDLTRDEIAQYVYSRLYTWSPAGDVAIFNDFAESAELPDPQLQEYIFKLRRGVKIHSHPDNPASDGELTSEDCKQSFLRRATAITADRRLALAIAGDGIGDPAALAAAFETPDPHTFSFKLAKPYLPTLRELARPEWSIVPASEIESYGGGFSGRPTMLGSGPFMLDEFRGTERIVLVRHPEYFLKPRPWLDRIVFLIRPDVDGLISGLKSGVLDAIASPIPRDDYLELKDDPNFTVSQAPTLSYPAVHLRMRPPFSDIRVREAIDLALNREKFIDEVWGGEGKLNGPVPWPLERWALPEDELRRAYPYDLDRAQALLDEAGHADGFSARLAFARGQNNATFDSQKAVSLIAQDLSRVGIELELDEVDLGEFIANVVLPGEFEMAFLPIQPYDDPDRPLAFYHTRGITSTGNWNGYSNPELDRLIEAQSEEFDEAKRRDLILEAQRRIIAEHAPQLTLPSGYEYHARRSYVHYPYEIGEPPSSGAGPWGSDIWTEEA